MGFWDIFKRAETKAVPPSVARAHVHGRVEWSDWDSRKAVIEGYKSVAWVYACINKRADALASIPLVVEVRRGQDWEVAPQHPLQTLLDYPNPDMDRGELVRMMSAHLDLDGNAYLFKVRAGRMNAPVELWPLLPHEISPVPGRERLISGYQHQSGGQRIIHSTEDIFHATLTNPASLIRGMSPLMAAGKAVDVDNAAAGWQKVSMQNRGVPDGVFSFPDIETGDQWETAREAVREQASQGNSRAPWVLGRATYTQLSMTPAEMDFMATRAHTMREICAVYGVPIEMIAGMGDANRASGENVRRTFWLETMLGYMEQIQSALNLGLARDFGPSDAIRIRFDTSSVPALQEELTEKITNARTLWQMGVPFDEANRVLGVGVGEVEGGDIGYIPAGVLPVGFDLGGDVDSDVGALAAPGGTEVQSQALNGAQIASLSEIVSLVAGGQLPFESAVLLTVTAFPTLSEADARAMLGPARSFTPREAE